MMSPIKLRDMKALAAYQTELMKKPRLRYIYFELTNQCNLKCLHCGSRCVPCNSTMLPYTAVKKTLLSISNQHRPPDVMVCLTGGEPFLHPELSRIVSLAHTMGFPVGITTNGTLIDEQQADAMHRCGLDTVAVSIDGTREIHERFRNCPGSFDRALSGARSLKRCGIEPQAITVANKSNLQDLQHLADVLVKEDFYSWRITDIDPIGRTIEHKNLMLDNDEMVTLLNFIRAMRFSPDMEMEVTYGCSHFLTYEYEREVRDFYFQCGAGLMVGSVMANGDIGACLDIERRRDLIQGNIFQDDFMTVWNERFEAFRVNRADGSNFCTDCEYREVCRGDSAHTWDYDLKEPLYCVNRGGFHRV